jgi:hypothetical protein
MKSSMRAIGPEYNTNRMVREYMEQPTDLCSRGRAIFTATIFKKPGSWPNGEAGLNAGGQRSAFLKVESKGLIV